MKAAGVIVEYNPFHNGHYYHIQKTKEKTNADIIIAVMSGNFLQRGEPALISKWSRTEMALAGGADLVVELPYAFATQNATTFAYGSIFLLDRLKANEVCFGSENGKIKDFYEAIHVLEQHKQRYEQTIKERMKTGVSYPRAATLAFEDVIKNNKTLDLTQPNNILGFQYISAIQRLNSNLRPVTIKRTGANYHDETFTSTIASATSIRKSLRETNLSVDEISSVIPAVTRDALVQYFKTFERFHFWNDYFPFLKFRLLSMTSSELGHIYEVEEGLENRLLAYIQESQSFDEFMKKIKTKRYTWTRLQRLCLHVLTNTTKSEMLEAMKEPHYIRLLGMSVKGQSYLNKIKKNLSLPIISKISAFENAQLTIDVRAANVYASIFDEQKKSKFIRDEYATPPIRIDR
jgi:predicted nucleotidyltransferase